MAYLNTYNLASQALEVGNVIALGANDVQFSGCCNGLSHAAGTGIINVKAPGVYEVNATVTVTATAAGAIGIQLYNGADAVPGAAASQTAAAAGEADFAELIGGKDAWLEALRTIDSLLKA